MRLWFSWHTSEDREACCGGGYLETLIFPAKRLLMLQLKGLLCTEPSILIELLAVWYIVLSEHHCVLLTAVRTPTPVATSCTVLPVVVVAIIFYHWYSPLFLRSHFQAHFANRQTVLVEHCYIVVTSFSQILTGRPLYSLPCGSWGERSIAPTHSLPQH
jgi:hypothetical protein